MVCLDFSIILYSNWWDDVVMNLVVKSSLIPLVIKCLLIALRSQALRKWSRLGRKAAVRGEAPDVSLSSSTASDPCWRTTSGVGWKLCRASLFPKENLLKEKSTFWRISTSLKQIPHHDDLPALYCWMCHAVNQGEEWGPNIFVTVFAWILCCQVVCLLPCVLVMLW